MRTTPTIPPESAPATTPAFASLDRWLSTLHRSAILAFSVIGVLVVGSVDYVTGYEISSSLFYVAPVALAAWYAGRTQGMVIAAISCVSWYMADVASGHPYSNSAIAIWNALIRLGFFVITAFLLSALKTSLLNQRHLARTDGLTGLFSRRSFEDRLDHDLAAARRRGNAITLAYVDLDNFKAINDRFGHAEGDRVLRALARVLKASSRETDTAARLGGDEFALLLPDTDGSGATQAIANLSASLRNAFSPDKAGIACSIGIVTILDPAMTAAEAVAAADQLMYQVKREGKGQVAFRVIGNAARMRAQEDFPSSTDA